MCFIVCHQYGIFGLGSKEKGLYLHAKAYEGGTGFGETGWGTLEGAKKVTWAQLSKHWIALSITIQSMSTRKKNCAIQWIVSYLVDGVILHLNNQGWLHFLRCPQPCHVVIVNVLYHSLLFYLFIFGCLVKKESVPSVIHILTFSLPALAKVKI